MSRTSQWVVTPQAVCITVGTAVLQGILTIPKAAHGMVVLMNARGSVHPRNHTFATLFQGVGLATLVIDLLTKEEAEIGHRRFDLDCLRERLMGVTTWLKQHSETQSFPIGYFTTSTATGAALIVAARHPESISTIVSYSGRPDLAGDELSNVQVPTLFLVGAKDHSMIYINEQAMAQMPAQRELVVIADASHPFREPGKLEELGHIATDWLMHQMVSSPVSEDRSMYYAIKKDFR